MTDKEVWLVVRRSLLFIVDAFDRKFECGKYGKNTASQNAPTATLTTEQMS
jgi:hypothetical protein